MSSLRALRYGADDHAGYRVDHRVSVLRPVVSLVVVGLLIWALWLQVQLAAVNRQIAELKKPIVVTGYPDRQFTTVNDLALAVLRVHQREKGLEAAIEEDLHSGSSAMLNTHQFIDNKRWAADAKTTVK